MIHKVTTDLYGVLALLVLPAESPSLESLNWLTDVFTSRDGTENRLKLRHVARTIYEYTIPRNAADRARAFNTEYGALRQKWAIPVWSQAQSIGVLASGALTFDADTVLYDLREASYALLFQTPEQFEFVKIATVEVDSVTLSAVTTVSFTSAYLIPIRVGYLNGSVKYTRDGYNDAGVVQFQSDDNDPVEDEEPEDLWWGFDIYYDEQLMGSSNYAAAIESREDRADFELGPITRTAPWLYTRVRQSFRRVLTTPEEVAAFRVWLRRRAGRFQDFMMPSYENDLRKANTGMVTTTLLWKKDGYDEWATDRTQIAIEDMDGNWHPFVLSNVEEYDANTLEGTLHESLSLDASRIKRISYLGLKRLASDRVDLKWIGNGVCQCDFEVVELKPSVPILMP